MADIKAQIAANQRGVDELARVVHRHGWPTVQAYMRHVMDNAEEGVRRVLDRIGDGQFDYTMDDGAPLRVAVRVDRAARTATVDFTGTGPQSPGNFNAPPAVTRAVVLYVFRCLVGEDIPLNDGCLVPISIVIPPGTFLSPAPGAAVVAGNTEVSQATCNALLGALGRLACSQATMNNVVFGDSTRQYYETICGGMGAGPNGPGQHAVQTHMTNTRMTDPEVFELRYPVRLESFEIRQGSGGEGRHRGGNGSRRSIRFLEPMTISVVASRRDVPPFGLEGGAPGAPGRQWIDRADGTRATPWAAATRRSSTPATPSPSKPPAAEATALLEQVIQALVSGLLMGLIYALVAAGLSLIFGLMDVVNFAHGEMMMVAMYAAVVLFGLVGLDPVLQLPIVAAFMFGVGVLTYRGVIARALGVRFNRGMVQIFATFGLAIFIRGAAQYVFGGDFKSVSDTWFSGRTANLAGIYVPLPQLAASVVCLLAFAGLLLVGRTEFGRALEATREDRDAVALIGIDRDRIFALGWGLGLATVGVAGTMLISFYYVSPTVGANFALIAYVTVALGGFGSILGALVAGIVIGEVEAITAVLLEPSLKQVGVFVVYLAVLLVRPRGLFGKI